MPDRATRNLLSVLSTQIPSFALVDGDPCGFDIYLTYRIGSWQMSHEQSLVSPKLRLLGVLPSQFEELRMPREALLPLSNRIGFFKSFLKVSLIFLHFYKTQTKR